MSAIGSKLRRVAVPNSDAVELAFWCPGCETAHAVTIADGFWSWNGDGDRPTFAPSVDVKNGHYIPARLGIGATCWCSYNAEHPDAPAPFKCGRCHSHVTDGSIQFLPDSTHALAGRTVPLPDFPGGE